MSVEWTSSRVRGASGVLDQVFSSLSNGLILYAVAIVTTPDYFGIIGVQLTLVAAALGCLRGGLGTSLLLMAGRGPEEVRREGSFAVTTAIAISPLLMGVLWLVGGSSVGTPTLLIAVAIPLVLVQDVMRYVVIAEGRPHLAALWDGVWFGGSLALLVSTWLARDLVHVNVLLGGWAFFALVSMLGLGVSSGVRPRVAGLGAWLRTEWAHRIRYAIDSGVDQLAVLAILAIVAFIVSPVVSGALRGATALLAPISMLTSSIPLVLIPDAARRSSTPKQLWRRLFNVSLITSVVTILAGFVISVLPDRYGYLLLGETFELTRTIIFPVALQYTIAWWALILMVWLKAFNRSAELLTLKLAYTIALTGAATIGAFVWADALGIAVCLVFAATLVATVALAWWTPWRAEATPNRGAGAGHGDGPRCADWYEKLVNGGTFAARPVADFVRLDVRRSGAADVWSPVIALWVFAIMGVLAPVAIIALTPNPPDLSWLGGLLIAVVAAARFAWIIGLGERRLFEIMFWSFTYPFMGLAPMTEVRKQTWPITTPRTDFTQVWPAIVIVALGTFAFLLGVFLERSLSTRRNRVASVTTDRFDGVVAGFFTVRRSRVVLLAIVAIAFNLYYSYRIGFIQFAQSREELNEATRLAFPSSVAGIFVRAGSYMSLLTAWVGLARFRREARLAAEVGQAPSAGTMRLNLFLLWFVGILLANSMNPISNARFLSGTAILAVAAAFGFYATAARFRTSVLGFLLALLVLFPIMDVFRYRVAKDISDANPINSFVSPDFDSFANVVNGYTITQREGINAGHQFLGVLAFWVPRAMWSDKPVDTGIYLAQSRGYVVVNLSAPLWIEIFINGGYVLLVLVMFALGYFLHAWDNRVDRQLSVFHMPGVLASIVPFYMFILLRGSLLQAMPYLMVTVVCWLFIRARNKPPPHPPPQELTVRTRPRDDDAYEKVRVRRKHADV